MDTDTNTAWEDTKSQNKRTYSSIAQTRPPSPHSPQSILRSVTLGTFNQPGQVSKVVRRKPNVNPQSWIVHFPKNDKVPDDQKYLEAIVVERVNELSKESTHFRCQCVSAKWTEAGNLSISFSENTKDTNVENSKVSILEKINHGIHGVTIAKNIPWSTLIINSVPCTKVELDEFN